MTNFVGLRYSATCWLLIVTTTACADEFARSIPADGAWAKFHWSERWDDGGESALQFIYKAVGTKTVGERRCRWIEIRVESHESMQRGRATIYKLLLPEQELGPDGDAIKGAAEVWRKTADEQAAAKFEGLVDNPRLYLHFFPLLPGRVHERVVLKERESVAWQMGRLDCSVVEGAVKESFTADRVRGRCRFAVHNSLLLGFAATRLEITNADGEHGVVSLSLMDYGTNAASELPDVK